MLKVPVAGRVKTRLARGIGTVLATRFYRHAVAALISRLNQPRRWSLHLAVAPDTAMSSPVFPAGTTRMPQGSGGLGRRLQHVVDYPATGPVIVIGSDVPGIAPVDIAEAFQVLQGKDVVLGPSPDGGYWLIGFRRRPRRLQPFRNIRWSTRHARADTLRNLSANSVGFVREKADIDDPEDWHTHGAGRDRRILAAR